MSDDTLQNLARIFTTLIEVHGVEVALAALPEDTYWKLYLHFMSVHKDDSQKTQL
jgi:hypothetical protein